MRTHYSLINIYTASKVIRKINNAHTKTKQNSAAET